LSSILNPLGFGVLLTSLYVLRFRAWSRPATVVVYFAFFTFLEWGAAHWFMPPDALPDVIGWLCLGLTVPVLVATYLLWRAEKRAEGRVEDRGDSR
jgi:hypothetical protein